LLETENTIRQGFLTTAGLLAEDDISLAVETIELIERHAIETVRVMFVDQHGILRGKTLTSSSLLSAYRAGVRVPSTLLLKNVSHRTVFPVWSKDANTPMRGASDVLLAPQPSTFRVLPHSPHSALVHCKVATINGEEIGFSSRSVLARAIDLLSQKNLAAVMGLEVEFNLFCVTDTALAHEDTTMPGRSPETRAINQGHQYLTLTRYSESEKILDTLRRAAQAMDMPVRSVEIEMGPGQFEFTFDPSDPMTIADMAVNFRTLVKEICQREGLLASFMPKPRVPNVAANGWHIHQSIVNKQTRENQFIPDAQQQPSKLAQQWIAGLIANASASCLLTTPTVNGYKSYSEYQLAPNRIGWSDDNRGAMVRTLFSPDDSASRIENRVADSSVNPYYALSAQMLSGLDGVDRNLSPPPPLIDPYDCDAQKLPGNLITAIQAFESSALYRHYLGDEFVEYLAHLKGAEWDAYLAAVSEWEQREYFTAF